MGEESAETDVPADGYCPRCYALDDEMCQTPSGAPRRNHAARHPSPPDLTSRPGQPTQSPEPTEDPAGALPRWYDPQQPLVACVDGPRSGAWYLASWLEAGWLDGYQLTGANPIPHRLDSRVTAQPIAWSPS